jgi:hypothetical protein
MTGAVWEKDTVTGKFPEPEVSELAVPRIETPSGRFPVGDIWRMSSAESHPYTDTVRPDAGSFPSISRRSMTLTVTFTDDNLIGGNTLVPAFVLRFTASTEAGVHDVVGGIKLFRFPGVRTSKVAEDARESAVAKNTNQRRI